MITRENLQLWVEYLWSYSSKTKPLFLEARGFGNLGVRCLEEPRPPAPTMIIGGFWVQYQIPGPHQSYYLLLILIVSWICTSLTWLWWFAFWLQQTFATTPAASKNITRFKSGQKWLKNNHLASLVWITDTLCSKKSQFVKITPLP